MGFLGIFLLSTCLFAAPGEREKKVLGADQRMRALGQVLDQFRAVGQLGNFCTATLVGPRLIVTAAHCIYNFAGQHFVQDLIFSPGRQGDNFPAGRFDWQRIYVEKKYWEEFDIHFDLAFILLKEEPDSKIPRLTLDLSSRAGESLALVGYPGEKTAEEENTLWYAACRSRLVMGAFHYACDTTGGMSGAPLVRKWGREKIVGIHTLGALGANQGPAFRPGHLQLVAEINAGNFSPDDSWEYWDHLSESQ